MGISLKYKLGQEDDHTRWRIPFQFSSVSFILLLLYNLLVTVSFDHSTGRLLACWTVLIRDAGMDIHASAAT